MSHDFRVVTTLEPESTAVSTCLAERGGRYSIEGELRSGAGSVFVHTRKRGASVPAFTVDGPFGIEIEDVDDPLVGVVLSPRWLTEISVASASSEAVRTARSLGIRLARTYQGAVYDPQEDAVIWPKGRPKRYKTPQVAETISLVKLRWYLPYSKRHSLTARTFIETARWHLFECVPRRYGLFEPPQGRVQSDDLSGFYALWDEAAARPYGDVLHFAASAPCFGGSVAFSDPRDEIPRNVGARAIVRVELDLDGRAMSDAAWRDASVSLFIAFARAVGAFYSIGYVETGVETRGGRLYFTADSAVYPLPRHNRWLGIPAVPAWLTWFGPPYADAVRHACEDSITARFAEGFLIRATDEPCGLEALHGSPPDIPEALCAKLSERTLSGRLASLSGPDVLPADERSVDRPADVIPPVG